LRTENALKQFCGWPILSTRQLLKNKESLCATLFTDITNIIVDKQGNTNITSHFGVGDHIIANAIHISPKGELAN
jgi:hypothetical protein